MTIDALPKLRPLGMGQLLDQAIRLYRRNFLKFIGGALCDSYDSAGRVGAKRRIEGLVDFLPAYYGIGVVTMFIDEQARRLGDLAAGTLVVRDRATVTLESLASGPTSSASIRTAPYVAIDLLPIERLSSQDIQMAEEFLRRQHQLSNPSAVASRIAKALLERMDVPASQMGAMSAQDLILKVVQASRSRETE